jgi:hypothetical protein
VETIVIVIVIIVITIVVIIRAVVERGRSWEAYLRMKAARDPPGMSSMKMCRYREVVASSCPTCAPRYRTAYNNNNNNNNNLI